MRKAQVQKLIVSAMPGVVGKVFPADQLLDAVELAQRAKALGFEARIVTVFDDETLRDFDPAGKSWGAELPASPFADAQALPLRKVRALDAK